MRWSWVLEVLSLLAHQSWILRDNSSMISFLSQMSQLPIITLNTAELLKKLWEMLIKASQICIKTCKKSWIHKRYWLVIPWKMICRRWKFSTIGLLIPVCCLWEEMEEKWNWKPLPIRSLKESFKMAPTVQKKIAELPLKSCATKFN